MVEGVLVLVTAFAIGREAWLGWQHPHAPETPFLGIALNGVAGLINLVWALVLIRCGRRWKSAALVAVNILWTGLRLLRESAGGLMDEIVDLAAVAEVRQVISGNAGDAIGAHDVRTRTAGTMTFIESAVKNAQCIDHPWNIRVGK